MISIETNMAAFNSTLAQYMALSSKTPDEVLEKKGRDLGIRLFQKFSAVKYGGPGARKAGLAKLDLKARTADGRGTKLRPSVLQEYLQQRTALRRDAAEIKSGISGYAGALSKRDANKNNRTILKSALDRINLWQSYVGKEVALRQRGIGVLAASFLWYRKRSSQARGTYFVRNQTSKVLGYVEKGENFLRIVGETEGLAKVDSRYGIVSAAIVEAQQDMVEYINTKQSALSRQLFGGAA
jgi:hypothetical protein